MQALAIAFDKGSCHIRRCSNRSTFAYSLSGCQTVCQCKTEIPLKALKVRVLDSLVTWLPDMAKWGGLGPKWPGTLIPLTLNGSGIVCPKLRNWSCHQTCSFSADLITFNFPSHPLLSSHSPPCSSLNTGGP